ncbi:cyclin PHO80-like domain containing protein [Babesia gibsoni]|uniref:Cyclin PHO80-like domain containing protein n=1 Tax=Babesia gibsoni TaxID=33632 RepID=A0AAD8P8P4_BABGI|nr:cyclin PHO80-like domain containing protein [Babesia gibsoni]
MGPSREQFVARATDDAFIKMLSNVLLRIVSNNDSNKGVVTRFHSMNAPPISISDYVGRIARHVRCSNECFVLALVYIERITKLHKNFVISVLNVHRLIITAVMLAAKFSDDVYYSNKFYAQVGGVNVTEINLLEAQFLSMLNFQLYVSAIEYESCRMGVEKANLFGCLSHSLWGVPWFHAGSKRTVREERAPSNGNMPMMMSATKYPQQQSNVSVCSTRYFDSIVEGNATEETRNGSYHRGAFARTMGTRSGSNVAMLQNNMKPVVYDMGVGQSRSCGVSMDTYSCQSSHPTTAFHMLSDVHMPQLPDNTREGAIINTPGNRSFHMNQKIYSANLGGVHSMEYPAAGSCSKHPRAGEALTRRPTRFLLNRLCANQVDFAGNSRARWNGVEQTSLVGFSRVPTIDENREANDDCEVFVNALEARYRETFKEKCVMNADSWSYEDNLEPYGSRQLLHFNKIPEAASCHGGI